MSGSKTKKEWASYYRKNMFRTYYNAFMIKSKINRSLSSKFSLDRISNGATQQLIIDNIKYAKPMMVSRFGCFESRCLGEGYGIAYGCLKEFKTKTLDTMHNNAGVFPYGQGGTTVL